MNWQTGWVWTDEAETSPRNRWQCFRRTFRPDSDWERAELSITADSRYVLYVNGRPVGRGPARSWPFELSYDTYEVGHLLKKGEINVIAVLVLHFGLATFAYLRGRGGLIAQLDLKSDGDVVQVIGTGPEWKTLVHPGYNPRSQRISCQLGFTEQFDSRALPKSWTGKDYDDTSWSAAKVVGPVGTAPWTELVPRDIPFLTEEPIQPARIESLHAVRPVNWTAAIDIRSAMLPSSADHANEIKITGYLATIIRVAKETTATLGFPDVSRRFGPVILNGKVYDFEQFSRALPEVYIPVPLKAGDNLFLLDLSGRYHGHTVPIGIDCEEPFELIAPGINSSDQGKLQEYTNAQNSPFVTLGPFEAKILVDHDNLTVNLSKQPEQENERLHPAIGRCTKPEDLAAFSEWLKPVPLNLISHDSIYSRFVWVRERVARPVPATLQNVVIANSQAGEVPRYAGADSEFVVDFGRELSGYIIFELDAPAGAIIDFYGIEYLKDGWRQPTYGLDNTLHYVCQPGRQRYTSLVRRGLRYLLVMVRYCELEENAPPVRFYNIEMLQSNYPVAEVGQFKCSDELLNSIWQISQHTTRLCMEDTFVDCPAYEQVFWVGDSRNTALINYYLFGANALVKHCLKLVPPSRFQSPLYVDQVPSGWNSVIPNWTFLWALACYEYYEQTGDLSFAKEIWPQVHYTMKHYLQRLDERGLFNIEAWNLLDWAALDQPSAGVVAHQNMLLVKTLTVSAKLAALAADNEINELYLQKALELKEAINRYLWSDEEKAYRDSIHADGTLSQVFSVQTQLLALLGEVAEEERANLLENHLQNPPSHFVKLGSPFMAFFYYEVLAKLGLTKEMLADMRLNYGQMVEQGATTCWEVYPTSNENPPDPRYLTRSHCHAWSAAPAYFLPAYILGVRSVAPGGKKVVIEPQPADLKWARGTIPLPKQGYIQVDWRLGWDEGSLRVEVWSPDEVEVTVKLPSGYQGEVIRHQTRH
jgi:hypothetical protein